MSSEKTIHIGIIGCGIIAPTHITAFQAVPNVQVKTLCDLVPEKANALAAQYNIEHVTEKAEDIFNDPEIDAVATCTDHESHAWLSIAALKAGKHVICEKPLSSSKENMDTMIAEWKKHPELVFAGIFQNRFTRSVLLAKELLEDARFGKILNAHMSMQCLRTDEYYAWDRWRGTWQQEGGSVMMNQAIHSIDIFQWLMGGVKEVHGLYANLSHWKSIETEDTAVAMLIFNNDALGTFNTTSASHLDWEIMTSIFGVDSTLELKDNELLRFVSKDKEFEREYIERFNAKQEDELLNREKYYYGSGHPAQIRDFIDAIRENRAPFITAEDARKAVDIAQKIYGRYK